MHPARVGERVLRYVESVWGCGLSSHVERYHVGGEVL